MRRPKPRQERHFRAVHDRARRGRPLMTVRALKDRPRREQRRRMPLGALKAVRPARLDEVVPARGFIGKPAGELWKGGREGDTGHWSRYRCARSRYCCMTCAETVFVRAAILSLRTGSLFSSNFLPISSTSSPLSLFLFSVSLLLSANSAQIEAKTRIANTTTKAFLVVRFVISIPAMYAGIIPAIEIAASMSEHTLKRTEPSESYGRSSRPL